MKTKDAYALACKQKDKTWWCRKKDDKPCGECKQDTKERVICWRIGWSRGTRKAFGDKEEILLCFLKRIDNGKAWTCGKKRGLEDALLTETKCKVRFPVRKVIDFRHAAWLLGWFEGYSEKKGDVSSGLGSRLGGIAGKCYICLLYMKGWMKDPEVNKLLGIATEE